MTSIGNITIAATVAGLPTGSKAFTLTYGPLTGAVGEILDVPLTVGNNTVTVPVGATWMLILPPAGNAVQLTLKGISGDQGWAMDLVRGNMIPLPAGTSIVNIGSAGTVTPEISFI